MNSRKTVKRLVVMATFLVTVHTFLLSLSQKFNSSDFSQDSRLLLTSDTSLSFSLASSNTSQESLFAFASLKPSISVSESPLERLKLSEGVFDQFRKFKTHMFSVTGTDWGSLSSSRLLCLGAQTSVDRLYELTELVTNWSGPMSISVFVPDIELGIAVKYIQYLRSCYPAIKRQVSFHLTYPADHPGLQDVSFDELVGRLDCQQPTQVIKYLLEKRGEQMMSWRPSYPYPQNLLRNTAKQGCQTAYTYIPDIDMVPTPGMDLQLETFLQKDQETNNCTKCAFVIPTYEISRNSTHLPQNKAELLTFLKEKQARQFHQALYSINQKSSNLLKWEKVPETAELEVAYKVEKYIFKYEPLYVSRGDTPAFDERFIGFGMTRNTQVIG